MSLKLTILVLGLGEACVMSRLVAAAQATPSPSPAARVEAPAAPVAPPKRRSFPATLVAIDAERGTVSFKDNEGKTQTWPVEVRLAQYAREYAEMRLATLTPGQKVRIVYAEDGGTRTIYDIRPEPLGPRRPDEGLKSRATPAPPQ